MSIFLTLHIAQAQSYKFGDVSKEELIETINDRFPEANAAILYRKQFIYFENASDKTPIQKTEIYERIKIYSRDGFDQAAKFISLYNNEKISDLKAVTYNLVDNEIISSSFKKDSIVEIINNSRINTSKYILPELKEGCIIEFKYILESECCFTSNIPLQMDIPIKRLDVRLILPDSLNFETIFNPNSTIVPKVDRSKRVREYSSNSIEENASIGQSKSAISENIIIITNQDVPALKDEPFANIDYYRAKLSLVPAQPKIDEETNLASNWNEISSSIYNSFGLEEELNLRELFEDDLKTVLNGNEGDIEKATILYNFIKLKMKWNGFDGYTPKLGISKAYSVGSGNTADINLTLLSMLRNAGLNAKPVLINTLNNGQPKSPSVSAFNYVICSVDIDNRSIFFDATDEFSSPNVLPLKVLNSQGLILNGDGTSKWIDLVPNSPSTTKVEVIAKVNPDLSISGNVKSQYTDYQAASYRNQFQVYTEKDLIQSIRKDNAGLKIYNFKSKSEHDLVNIINQSYEFSSIGEIRRTGNKLFFSPLFFLENKENIFNEDTRNYPIDFKYPVVNEYKINIIVPQGYKVEYLPKNYILHFNNEDGEFRYLARKTGNILQFIITLKLNKTLVLPEEYQKIRQFYQSILDKKKEEVILIEENYEPRRRTKNSR